MDRGIDWQIVHVQHAFIQNLERLIGGVCKVLHIAVNRQIGDAPMEGLIGADGAR